MGLLIDEEFKVVERTIPYGARAIHLGRQGVLLGHHPRYDYYEFFRENEPVSDTNPSWWPKGQFKLISSGEHEKTNLAFSNAAYAQ